MSEMFDEADVAISVDEADQRGNSPTDANDINAWKGMVKALEAENERLRAQFPLDENNARVYGDRAAIRVIEQLHVSLDKINENCLRAEQERDRLRAELATAYNDALEEAAKVCESLAVECVSDHPDNAGIAASARGVLLSAAHSIRALKREGGGT